MARLGAFIGEGGASTVDRVRIAEVEGDFQGLPELSKGGRHFLENYEGDRAWLLLEARQLAQMRGSLMAGREHMIIALRIAAGTWPEYLCDGPEDEEEEEGDYECIE